jgi:quercetin dioxygenase-like cupin family protein
MNTPHVFVPDLATASEIPAAGILSRTLYSDEQVNVVLFGFAAGEELSEHTSSMSAILQIISGKIRLKLGAETLEANPGAWVHMAAQLPHSIHAEMPTVMLLTLLKTE